MLTILNLNNILKCMKSDKKKSYLGSRYSHQIRSTVRATTARYILKNKNCMFYACFAKILLLLLVNSYGGARAQCWLAGRRDEIYYE